MKKDWVDIELRELASFVIGGDWGKHDNYQDPDYEFAFCIRGYEFRNWSVEKGKTASLRRIKKNSIEKRKLQLGDILIEISGGGPEQPVGRTVLIDREVLNNLNKFPIIYTNFLRLFRPVSLINSKWLNAFLTFFYNAGKTIPYQGGSNNLRNLKFQRFETIKIPLSPFPIQRAILTKIENLFISLDMGIADLKKAQQQLKVYRQAVLKKAFEGDYPTKKVMEFANVKTGSTPKRGNSRFWSNGTIPWITSGALK